MVGGRDPRARVRHAEAEGYRPGTGGAGGGLRHQRHLAPRGVGERVAEQIGQDLAQPQPVDEQAGWQLGVEFEVEPQTPLRRQGREVCQAVFQQPTQPRGAGTQREVPALQSAQVKQVVDQGQQMATVALDTRQQVPAALGLFRVGGRLWPRGLLQPGQDLGKAEDGMQGGAQFVGDGGQEAALGGAGGLGGIPGLPQRCLLLLTQGDVAGDTHELDELAVTVIHRHGDLMGPVERPVFAPLFQLGLKYIRLPGRHPGAGLRQSFLDAGLGFGAERAAERQ